jgi:hypothetical protein
MRGAARRRQSALAACDQIIAGTLEPGVEQVIDVFDGKIVVRKPIAEKEKNGNGKKKAKAEA